MATKQGFLAVPPREPPTTDDLEDELSDEEDQDLSDDDELLGPEEDAVKAAFDSIMTDVKMRRMDLKGPRLKEFVARYGRQLGEKTAIEQRTLLHLAALEVTNKPLIRLLLKRHPELMAATDYTGKTPLHIAITRRKVGVLQTMCAKFKDQVTFDRLLAARHDNQRNAIHLAILARLDSTVLVSLIRQASEDTLCARDDRGCTPLHLAVEYDRCTNSQFRVIRALIEQGDRAMDQFMNAPHEYSVYEYHEYTAAQRNAPKPPPKPQQEKPASANKRPEPEERGRPEAPKPGARSKIDRDPMPDKPGRELPTSRADPLKVKTAPQDPRLDRLAMATKAAFEESKVVGYESDAPGVWNPTVQVNSPGTSTPPKLAIRVRTNTALRKSVSRKEEEKVTEESAKRIKDELRLHFLRSTFEGREHEDAVRFLYGNNTRDVQICFDLLEAAAKLKSAKITQEEFKRSYEHIVFSDVLRYVALRTVDLEPLTPAASSSRPSKWARLVTDRTPQQPSRGRNDMVFFFQWLRDKGVKRILKVTVDDMTAPSHADEAIEQALGGLQVEMLDWRKLDLCPSAVEKASKEIREIWLQWSGNNTVLRGWSESEGLPRLLMLKEVHLFAKEGLDSPARTAENIKTFRDRLQRERDDYRRQLSSRAEATPSKDEDGDDNVSQQDQEDAEKAKEDIEHAKAELEQISPIINVGVIEEGSEERHVSAGVAGAPNGANGKERLLPHRWLDTMDDFADQIVNISVPETNREELKHEIKVALVDDGVDIHHQTLRGRIQSGMTFDMGSPDEGRPSPYYVTSTGHGTVMADMICRVCPQVKLHVFKLQTHMSKDRVPQISARSAAHAIEAAVARKVDIISMSWTISDTNDNHDDLELLGAAMNKAFAANILLFCAASDKGAHADTDYPAAWNVKRVFRIGAATAEGRAWTWTGDLANLDFILPGHNVLDRTAGARSGSLLENFTPQTGSSVATALAAGLAGLVLHCVRLGAIVSEGSGYAGADGGMAGAAAVKVKDLAEMRKHDNMKAAFKAIGTSDIGQHKFVEVWHRFEPACKELKGADRMGRLEIVATLARDLIAGISGAKGQIG